MSFPARHWNWMFPSHTRWYWSRTTTQVKCQFRCITSLTGFVRIDDDWRFVFCLRQHFTYESQERNWPLGAQRLCVSVWVWLTYGDKHTISAYHRLVNSLRIDACSWETVAAPRLQRMQPNQIGIKRNHSEARECVCVWVEERVCCLCQVNETQTFLWSSLTVRAFDNLMFICLSVCDDDDDDDEVTKLWSGECGNGVFEWISARQQQQHCEAHKPVLTCADVFRIFFFQFTFDSIKSKSDVIHCCCRDFGAEFCYFCLFVCCSTR